MTFLYFLLKNHIMQQAYGSWYLQNGLAIGLIEAAIIALLFVVLFYYVLPIKKFKLSLRTSHWLLFGFLSAVVTFAVTLFTGRSLILKYITANELEGYQPGCSQLVRSIGAIDLWMFAINSVILGVVIYFIFSVILKRWATISNVPFGSSHKNRKEKR